jgi:probable HAF family extracellular repeat protein
MKTRFRIRLGILALGLLSASLAQGATYYVASVSTTDLGNLGGPEASALDINNRGVIVGYSKNPAMTRRAFRWQGGVMTDIGTPTSSARSIASGINDYDEIVGQYGDPDEFNWQAFYWSPGTGVITLNRSLYPSQPFDSSYVAIARAINNKGVIVGTVEAAGLDHDVPVLPCFRALPVVWGSAYAKPKILHCPEGTDGVNSGSDINDSNWITGYELPFSGADNGFVWKSGTTTHAVAPIFGSHPRAFGINESGVVVGTADLFGTTREAFRWNGAGTSQWLGVLSGGSTSEAAEVNDQGFVTGTSDAFVEGGGPSAVKDRAYLWHADFGMFALPVPAGMTPVSTSCDGSSLNNLKTTGLIQVVGHCGTHAIRWNVLVLSH